MTLAHAVPHSLNRRAPAHRDTPVAARMDVTRSRVHHTPHQLSACSLTLDTEIQRRDAEMTQPLIAGIRPNEAHEQPQEVRASAHLSSYVLLIDDEPAVRHMLTRWLEGWGYATKHAASAAQALEMMRAE